MKEIVIINFIVNLYCSFYMEWTQSRVKLKNIYVRSDRSVYFLLDQGNT